MFNQPCFLQKSGGKVSTLKKPKGDAEKPQGGLHLVSCARDKKVIVWSVKTGDIIFTLVCDRSGGSSALDNIWVAGQ